MVTQGKSTSSSGDEPTVNVLYRDDCYLVLDKPSGMPTTSPRDEPTLVGFARTIAAGSEIVHPTSRLDALVTGAVTFALTRRANETLRKARREQSYLRAYLGIAEGMLAQKEGEWTWRISIDAADKKLRRANDIEGDSVMDGGFDPQSGEEIRPLPAITRYRAIAQNHHGTLVWLFPKTGRTHQLRVHIARSGAPLIGDIAYSGPRRIVFNDGSVATFRRPMLHCRVLRIPHPNGTTIQIEAPIPVDFGSGWAQLKHAHRPTDQAILDESNAELSQEAPWA